MNTLMIGASDKPDRYSYKAMNMLLDHGHQVFLVNPKLKTIKDIYVHNTISGVTAPIDTVTVYVNAAVSDGMEPEILKLRPRRVIFNPGAENPRLARVLRQSSIEPLEACTLVLLQTNQF